MEVEEVEVSQVDLSQVDLSQVDLKNNDYVEEINASALSDGDGTRVIRVKADILQSTPNKQKQYRGKQKQYSQKYRMEWEYLDFCKGWLKPHRSNKLMAFCKACNRELHASKNDLRKHSISSKHKNNMVSLESGTPVSRSDTNSSTKIRKFHPGLLDHPELTGWCAELPGKGSRVWCRQCRCSLTAQLKALKTHSQSRKHLANADQEPMSPPPTEGGGDFQLLEMTMDGQYSANDDTAGPSGYDSAGGGGGGDDGGDDRAASPLLESDFSGRVTYSIGLGNRKVGFLGAGQIAQAIAQGMLEQGLLLPHDVIVSAPSQRNMLQWKRWKCKTTNSNDELVREADIVFVAVKASVLVRLIGRLATISDGKTRLFISLVPGVPRDRMTAMLSCRVLPPESVEGSDQAEFEVTGPPLHVIRCAPNKMMSISAGFCAYCMGEDVPHALYLVVETMFSALGTCVQVEEHLMDAYSTMIASGAAFTCAFIEAMVQGGVSLDMGWDEALKVASSVVSGTSKLLLRTSVDPSALRKTISTPGGSTIAGLAALQRGGLDDAVGKALQLACEKTKEIGDTVCGVDSSTVTAVTANISI